MSNNQIQIYSQFKDPLDAINQIGDIFAKSGFANLDNPSAGKMLALVCFSEQMTPTQLLRTYDIVKGKLRKKALASFAEFRQAGGKVKWLATGEDGKEAKAEFTFEGQTLTLSFTMQQAIQGGAELKTDKGHPTVWAKTPGNMLRARLVSNAVAMLCPEIFAGGDGIGEMEDEPTPAPEIKLAGSNVQTQPVAASPAPVIVEAEVVKPEPTVKVTGLGSEELTAWANKPTPPPTPTTPAPTPLSSLNTVAGAKATNEQIAKLETLIGYDAVAVGKFLVGKNKIMAGQGLDSLTQEYAQIIIKNFPQFMTRVKEFVK